MKRFWMLVLLMCITLAIASGCAQATPEPTATAMPTQAMQGEMEPDQNMEEGEAEHGMEMHEAAHGGQVGMAMGAALDGSDFHLEIVSASPGQYRLYLSDENREPVSPQGYQGTLAVINPDGSAIASLPLNVMDDHLSAEGGPTGDSQLDVRITLQGPDLAGVLEMDFVMLYTE